MAKWPDSVPILTPDDVNPYRHDPDQPAPRSLRGWMNHTFGGKPQRPVREEIYIALIREGAEPNNGWRAWFESLSVARTVRIWNRAMARLGYVVDNPEAEKVREC